MTHILSDSHYSNGKSTQQKIVQINYIMLITLSYLLI